MKHLHDLCVHQSEKRRWVAEPQRTSSADVATSYQRHGLDSISIESFETTNVKSLLSPQSRLSTEYRHFTSLPLISDPWNWKFYFRLKWPIAGHLIEISLVASTQNANFTVVYNILAAIPNFHQISARKKGVSDLKVDSIRFCYSCLCMKSSGYFVKSAIFRFLLKNILDLFHLTSGLSTLRTQIFNIILVT